MRRTSTWIGLVAMSLLAGCSCEAGLGESCDKSSDCEDGLICVDGKCAREEPGVDAGPEPDSGVDAGPVETIEDIPVDEEIALADLDGPVDVVIDAHGIPHIYATTVHDMAAVEGFMIARDRFVQLELGRRQASGRLGEIIGSLFPSAIGEDIFMRVIGLRRLAEAELAAVEPGSDVEAALEGYAIGVNAFIERLRAGDESLPTVVGMVLQTSAIEDWAPIDSLLMGQFQSFLLDYDGLQDADRASFFDALSSTFTAASADPDLAARDGAAQDLTRLRPSLRVSVMEGRLDQELDARRVPMVERPRLSAATLDRARHGDEIGRRIARRWGRGSDYGSNNWLISGALTASGAPMMSNDPHLSLSLPATFYQVHLNTARNGSDAQGINAAGDTFAGVPGIVLGFTDHIAWGGTVAFYDRTDVYAETLTPGDSPTTLFNGEQVAITIIHEEVGDGSGGTVPIDIEWVPHHGPLAPIIEDGRLLPHTETEALSIRWADFDALTDPGAQKVFAPFVGALRAQTVDDFDAAWEDYASNPQNWVVADTSGNILWTTKSRMPERDPVALTFDPTTGEGLAPCFVLPGTGEAEWTGLLPKSELPHLKNPARGWISTANNDQTGASFDGNPFDADPYLGWSWGESAAHRAFRVDERLTALAAEGGITIADLQSVQAEHRSMLGARIAPHLIAAMERASTEASSPGTHPDLTDVVTAAGDDWSRVEELADRLAAWTFDAASGYETGDADEIADSVATTIFNVAAVELVRRALADELEAAGLEETGWLDGLASRTLLAMLEPPEDVPLVAMQDGESVLWDDLATPGVVETKDAILVASLVAALTDLTTDDPEDDADLSDLLGDDEADWRWGKLHTVRLSFFCLPNLGCVLPSIPADDSAEFPNGFPRHGDNFSVDASSPGLADLDFSYDHGPNTRTVVELLTDGVHGEAIIPGGQSSMPQSAHYADEMELWRTNQTHRIPLDEPGVVSGRERRLHLTPN